MALTDNLDHYWKLDESSGNAADSAGSVSLTNTSVTYAAGKINNGASFNASAKLSGSVSSGLGSSFSINFWFKLGADDNSEYALIESYVSSYSNYYIYIYKNGSKQLTFDMYDGTNNPHLVGSTTLAANTWYMCTAIRDVAADNLKIYLNTASDATAITDTTTSTPSYGNLNVGRRNNDTYGLNGMVDEVRVYSRAITTTEIQDLFVLGLKTNLQAVYKLDNTSDATSNAYTLTNNNSVSFSTGLIGNCADMGSSNTTKYLSRATDFSGGGNFTVSAWVNVYSTSDDECHIEINSTAQPWFRAFFARNGAGGRWLAGWHGGGDNASYTVTISSATWYHVVLTNTSGTLEMFINGVSRGTASSHYGSTLPNQDNSLLIGSSVALLGVGVASPGKIDAVHVWNRALSAGEVSFMYNGGSGYEVSYSTLYNIIAAQASFTNTGQAALFHIALRIAAAYASFVETGQSVLLKLSKGIQAAYATFTLLGQDSLFHKVLNLVTANGSFTLTGNAATLTKAMGKLMAAVGQFVVTGEPAGLSKAWTAFTAAYGSFSLTGQNANTLLSKIVGAVKGTFSLVGNVTHFLINGVETKWAFGRTKHSSTYTNNSKHTPTWTNRNKS